MGARTVVLAVNHNVMDDVTQILRSGAMLLSKPAVSTERLHVHALDAPHLPALKFPTITPADVAARLGLTARMFEVLQLLGCGLTTKEIGDRLGVGEMTVKTHATRLYRALGVKGGAAEAVAVGYRRGLLTGDES
jgi:DNA-binding NarL/FixJ family response regulator